MNDYSTTDFRIRRKRIVQVELCSPDTLAGRLVKVDYPLLVCHLFLPLSFLSYRRLPLFLPLHHPKSSTETVKHMQEHIVNELKKEIYHLN